MHEGGSEKYSKKHITCGTSMQSQYAPSTKIPAKKKKVSSMSCMYESWVIKVKKSCTALEQT